MKQHQDEEVEKLDREGYRSSSSSPSPPSSHPKFGGKCPRKQYVERRPGTLLDWEGNGNAAGGDDSFSSSSSSSDSSSSDEEDDSGSSSSSSSFEDDVDKANVRAVQPQRRWRAAVPVVAARSSEDEVARLKNVVSDLTNNMNTLTEAMTEQLRIQNQTKAKQQQQQQRRRELQQQRRKQQKEAGPQQRQQPQGIPRAATSSSAQRQQQQHRPTSVSASSSAVASSKPHQQSRSGSVSPKPVASSPAASPKPVASSPAASPKPVASSPAASYKPAASSPAASYKPAASSSVASPKPAAALKAVSPLAVSSSQTAVSKLSSPVTVVAAKKPASLSPAVPKESVLQMMQKGGVHSPQPAQKKQCVDDDGKKKVIRVDVVGNKPVITIVPKIDDQKKKSDKEEEKKEEEKKEDEKKEEKKKEEEPRQKRSHAEINKEEAMGEKGEEEAKSDERQNESDSDDKKPPKKKHKHHYHHHRRDQKRKDSKRSGTEDESEVEDEEEEEVPKKKKKVDMPPPPLPSSPQPQPQTRRRRVVPSATASEVKQRLKKMDKKKRRTLAIVKYYTDTSTKLRACGNCAKCLAPTCGICTNCKRNANMKADSLRKSKKRCTALTCERVTKKDIAEQRLLLTGESYHIRPELSQLEKARIKWAKTACRYCNDERGAFARRMRDNKLQQIVFTIKNFRKELEAAGEVSAKLVRKFLDKGKVKYYKSEDEDETFNMGEEGDEGMVGGESMDGEEDE